MNSNFAVLLWVDVIVSSDKNCFLKLGEWRLYWETTGRWPETINWSDTWLKILDIQLAILQINNCCFIRQKWSLEIGGVTAWLGHDEKMTQTIIWWNAFDYVFLLIYFNWMKLLFFRQMLSMENSWLTVLLEGKLT